MAATVTGTFRILDRASRPMEGMRREAERLDKALLDVGDHMDDIGTNKQLSQLDATEKHFRDMDRTAEHFGGSGTSSTLGKTRRQVRGLGDDSDRLTYKLGRLAAAFSGVQKILGLMKIPVVVTAVVWLTQAVGALAGGLVALFPRLVDTVGILGTLPAALSGVALAAISTKVALSGLGPAIEGTEGAMAKLTPRAREFVKQIKELKPLGKSLQANAQAGLLPGLSDALSTVTSKGPVRMVRRLLKNAGQVVGDTASQAATAFTRRGFLRDFERVSQQGLGLMSRFGSVLINVAQALIDVAVSAEPFTSWMAQTIQMWSVGWREAANLGRKTGELGNFFDRTRDSLELFGSILHNLWDTFKGLGRAARPLGDDLWKSADKATERWARFTNSVTGQEELRSYFESLKEPLHAIFDFVGELGTAIARLGASSGFTTTTRRLTEAIVPLEEAFEDIGANLGPAMAETLEQLVRLFANLTDQSGAFAHLLETLNFFLEGINALLDAVPGLTNLITGVLGAVALSKLTARLRGVGLSWGFIANEATRATVAQRGAMMSPGGVVGGAGGGGRRGGRGGSTVPVPFGVSTGGTPVNRRGRTFNPRTTNVPTSFGEYLRGGALGAGGAMALRGARAAGRFLGPAALVFGAIDSLSYLRGGGSLLNTPGAAFSGGTFGLVPSPTTGSEAQEQLMGKADSIANQVPRSRSDARAAMMRLQIGMKDPNELLGSPDTSWSTLGVGPGIEESTTEDARKRFTAAYKRIGAWLKGRNRQMGAETAMEFTNAWAIYADKASNQKAFDALLGPLSNRLNRFVREDAPEAATVLGNSVLAMAAEAKRKNPKLADEYDKLENRIERAFRRMGRQVEVVNGRIYTGSAREWENIERAIATPAEKAAQRTSEAFTAMQQQAIGSLVAMGYSRSEASEIVQGMERGGRGGKIARIDAASGPGASGMRPSKEWGQQHGWATGPKGATGMRIPGSGLQDTVPLVHGMAAPGELIVNRHTERDIDRDLSAIGAPTMGQRVAGESRRHSDPDVFHARGGRVGAGSYPDAMGALPGLDALAWILKQKFGLSVMSGLRPGSITTSGNVSDHSWGGAIDMSNGTSPTPQMDAAWRWLASTIGGGGTPTPGVYTGGAIKQMLYRTMIGGNHFNHVHVALNQPYASNPELVMKALGGGGGAMMPGGAMGMMGPGGGGAVPEVKIKVPDMGGGGAPGAMAQAAATAYGRGLEGALNKRLGGRGPGGGGRLGGVGGNLQQFNHVYPEHGLGQPGTRFSPQTIEAIASWAGLPPLLFRQIALGESGYYPGITGIDPGGTKGYGLWMITTSFNDARVAKYGGYGQMLNPLKNAQVAAEIYRESGTQPWYGTSHVTGAGWAEAKHATGGRVPEFAGWFGTGGTITAHGPTLLGIGESGTETATVTHGSGSGGGKKGVVIQRMEIHNNRPGDIKSQVKEEVAAAFAELESEFDLDMEAEEGVL